MTVFALALATCDSATPVREVAPVVPVPAEAPKAEVPVETPTPAPAPADFSKVLGSYETKYGAGGNRGKNIERAASFFQDGIIVRPGEVLSFNEIVGPRDERNGFLKAPVIVNGEMTDGDGGGTCQVSSTLHAACLMARLSIESRTPHSRPSGYLPVGMDATVVWPNVDFKVKNEGPTPILIAMTTTQDPKRKYQGLLHVEVRGGQEPAPKPEYTTRIQGTGETFKRRTKDADAGAPAGFMKKVQKGANGMTVYSTLTFPEVSSTLWRSVYPPTDEVWEVGPGWSEEQGMPWEIDAGVDAAPAAPALRDASVAD